MKSYEARRTAKLLWAAKVLRVVNGGSAIAWGMVNIQNSGYLVFVPEAILDPIRGSAGWIPGVPGVLVRGPSPGVLECRVSTGSIQFYLDIPDVVSGAYSGYYR